MLYWAKKSRICRKTPNSGDYLFQSAIGGPAEPKMLQETFKRYNNSAIKPFPQSTHPYNAYEEYRCCCSQRSTPRFYGTANRGNT